MKSAIFITVPRTSSTPLTSRKKTSRPLWQQLLQYILIFGIAVAIVVALVGEKGFLELGRVRQQHRALEAALAQARAHNMRLRNEVKRLNNDPGSIEEIARRELGLIKPGEKLFIVKDIHPK